MSKRAVLMMTFGSPEEITYEGVAEYTTWSSSRTP